MFTEVQDDHGILKRWKRALVYRKIMSSCRIVSSQIYGPGYCLLPRLDVVPCQNFYPLLPTPDPSDKYITLIILPSLAMFCDYLQFLSLCILSCSQFSIYQTVFARGPAGLPICYPTGPPAGMQGVQDISSIGNLGQVKFLISPGIGLEPAEP